jgi:hypothetical protein
LIYEKTDNFDEADKVQIKLGNKVSIHHIMDITDKKYSFILTDKLKKLAYIKGSHFVFCKN